MKILIVVATQFEVQPLFDFLEIKNPVVGMNMTAKGLDDTNIQVLVTGVGMVNTAFMLGRYALGHYDLLLNVGVCGAFNKSLKLGQIVNVTEDVLSELGAEDGNEFLTYDQLNLGGKHIFTNNVSSKYKIISELKKVNGITVNTIHGDEYSIEKVKKRYHPEVESMEGAAFFAACLGENQFAQIRAISNYVEKRDKSKWQMTLAIKNLNEFLINFINSTI